MRGCSRVRASKWDTFTDSQALGDCIQCR